MTSWAQFYTTPMFGGPKALPGGIGTAVRFSPARALEPFDAEAERFLGLAVRELDALPGGVAVYGEHASLAALLGIAPKLRSRLVCRIVDFQGQGAAAVSGLPVCGADALPPEVRTVYLNVPGVRREARLRHRLGASGVGFVSLAELGERHAGEVPARAWVERGEHIYPLPIPELELPEGLDFLLLDLPAKNMGFMPNGLAYVHNALRKEGVCFRTFDLDIVVYHRFHMHRLLDAPWSLFTPKGRALPEDPWRAEHSGLWKDEDFLDFFRDDLEEFCQALHRAAPRIVGFSVHEANGLCVSLVTERLRRELPETLIIAGGYSCLDPAFARAALPEADYTVVGEADLSLGPLVKRLLRGERPADLPGIMSRLDTPGRAFVPLEPPQDLDALEPPDYEWFGPGLYRNYDGYQLIPVTISRGCRWSRCTFCTERFPWRSRSARYVADELEFHQRHGGDLFLFNDSDFNGDPGVVLALCQEIKRRGLVVRLTGQLRISRHNTREYFGELKQAGFVSLHFGVDAWSRHSLVTARKGYTEDVIVANLKACHEAELFSEVNLIVGYPGETEEDVDETIANIVAAKSYIGRIAVINPLMMKTGCLFWERSEHYGIRFSQDKDDLARRYPTGVPSHFWHSDPPLLDEVARNARVLRVVRSLMEHGVPLGEVAQARLREMEAGQDAMRGGLLKAQSVSASGPAAHGPHAARFAASFIVERGGVFFALDGAAAAAVCTALHMRGCAREDIAKALRGNKALVCEVRAAEDLLLVSSALPGYNIIQLGRRYAAFRHGVAFDALRFALGAYPPKDCVPGDSVAQVLKRLRGA